jgi:hypothetical protein
METSSLRTLKIMPRNFMFMNPASGWANFSIMMECKPESGHCHSVCSGVYVQCSLFKSTIPNFENCGRSCKGLVNCVRKCTFYTLLCSFIFQNITTTIYIFCSVSVCFISFFNIGWRGLHVSLYWSFLQKDLQCSIIYMHCLQAL